MKESYRLVFLVVVTIFLSVGHGPSLAATGGMLTIGVRADTPPFSWRNAKGDYEGFSVGLCRRIGEKATEEGDYSGYELVPVSARDRFEALESAEIDLLCGATTVTLERMRPFDFTLFTFLSGASYMSSSKSEPVEFDDLKKKRIGVLRDTTTETLLRERVAKMLKLPPDGASRDREPLLIVPVDKHFDSIEMLRDGKIDVYFADREILLSLRSIARRKYKADFRVATEYLSYEPYALAVRRDAPDLLFRANQTLVELFREQSIFRIFKRWFPGKAMSSSLEELYLLQRLPEGSPTY